MKSATAIAPILVLFFGVLHNCQSKSTEIEAELSPKYLEMLEKNPRLAFLGSVQGKFYFYDDTAQMTWFQAKDYCTSMNMALASITTQEQADLFHSNVEKLNRFPQSSCCSSYWTSGRDAQTWKQFLWDGEEDEKVQDFGPVEYLKIEFQTCVRFIAGSDNRIRIAGNVCAAGFKVLCQGS